MNNKKTDKISDQDNLVDAPMDEIGVAAVEFKKADEELEKARELRQKKQKALILMMKAAKRISFKGSGFTITLVHKAESDKIKITK